MNIQTRDPRPVHGDPAIEDEQPITLVEHVVGFIDTKRSRPDPAAQTHDESYGALAVQPEVSCG